MKIISGGQTGADRTALETAQEMGIPTGGWVPKGWLTEEGSDISLKLYSCKEHESSKYPPRTKANVLDSDGTVWFGKVGSAGFHCTKKATQSALGTQIRPFIVNPTGDKLREWVKKHRIEVLNVAGNRKSKNPEVVFQTRDTLQEAFSAKLFDKQIEEFKLG